MASLIQTYQRFDSFAKHLKEKNTKAALKDVDHFARVGAINYRFAHGNTLLMSAAQFDDAIIIKKLVTKGAEVDATLPGHLTPLQIASYFGKEAAVEQLLANKANVSIAHTRERLPITYAVSQGYHSIAERLLSNGANARTRIAGRGDLLTIASQAGDAQMVKILLQHGAKDKNNRILKEAIQQHRQEVVDALLGVDKHKDQTALMRAAERGDQDIFSALVDAGADLTATDRKGENVGDYARRGNMHDLYTQKITATAKSSTTASIIEAVASIVFLSLPIIYCLPRRRKPTQPVLTGQMAAPAEEEKRRPAPRKKHR